MLIVIIFLFWTCLDVFIVAATDHELVGGCDGTDAAAVRVVSEGGELKFLFEI